MKELKDLAVKVFGMTDDEWQSLIEKTDEGEALKPDAIPALIKKDQERLKRIKEEHKLETTSKYNDGYSKAKKEERQKFEDEIKTEFGLDTSTFGIDLVKEIVSLNSKKGSDVDIKTHPEYLKLEKALQAEFVPKSKYEEVENQFNQFKTTVEKEKVYSRIDNDALSLLDGLNPILPKDAKKASNQKHLFLRQIKDGFDFQPQDDGNHLILREGKRLENENMNPIAFADFVKSKASELFDFSEQSQRGNSGVDAPEPLKKFSNIKEFQMAYGSETDPERRVKMYDDAKAQGLL